MNDLFLKTLRCEPVERRPIWLMRQAGRYLPEYLEFRKKHSLLSCFREPELAAEITKMPLRRFGFDAAILFSDLLVPVEVWGKELLYPEAGGPQIVPPLMARSELYVPTEEELQAKLSYVFDAIAFLKPELSVPLIGFCGAPFTLLCYLLQGKGGHGFSETRAWIDQKTEDFVSLLDIVCETCIRFASLQIRSGVCAFQIFDSWANLLSKEEFSLYVLPYWKRMRDALAPLGAPLLFFSRANSLFPEEISSISPQGISFDEGMPLAELREKVPAHIAVQGNFSPELLLKGSVFDIKQAAFQMAQSVEGKKGIIWNLGHGVLPRTPLEDVEALLETLHSF